MDTIIITTGNIGKNNAVLKTVNTEDGRPYSVSSFWMAHNRKTKTGEKATWYNVCLFYKFAETMAPYLTSGRKVLVQGRPEPAFYTKDGQIIAYTKIYAEKIELLDYRKAEEEPEVEAEVDPEELPFD